MVYVHSFRSVYEINDIIDTSERSLFLIGVKLWMEFLYNLLLLEKQNYPFPVEYFLSLIINPSHNSLNVSENNTIAVKKNLKGTVGNCSQRVIPIEKIDVEI